MKNIFWRDERVIGRAIFAAKCSVIARYPTNDTYYGPAVLYTLFGDPALRVKLRMLTGLAAAPVSPVPARSLEIRPNPTRGTSVVRYELTEPGHVTLRLLTCTGAVAGVLVDGSRPAGENCCAVDTKNLAAGVYVVQLAPAPSHGALCRLADKLIVR